MEDDKQSKQSKGGEERARGMSARERSESARKAVLTRWAETRRVPLLFAKYGAPDRPLRLGNGVEIPAYVLADGTRVIVQRGMQTGIGMSTSGGTGGAHRLAQFVESLEAKGLDVKGLAVRIRNPFKFYPSFGGKPAYGYEATILPDLCRVVVDADRHGLLSPAQRKYADQCSDLLGAFGSIGIIALIDEATGYQDARPRDALALILEKFVAKELQPWVRTFEPEFYKQIFRLNGWVYEEGGGSPGVVGHWTNNIVYSRLAPAVLEELKKKTPRTESGRLKNRLFQWLTGDIGHPKLREHLAAVTMLMKYSPNWRVFMDRLDREFPQYGKTMMLAFPADYEAPPAADVGEAT